MIKSPEEIRNYFSNRRMTTEYGDAEAVVKTIVRAVEAEGDAALNRISLELDAHAVREVPKHEWKAAYGRLEPDLRDAIEAAKIRLEQFYTQEPRGGFLSRSDEGLMGQVVRPLERVGVYVPGGTAPLFSTLLMTAVPARIAGVQEIIVATPPVVHPAVLAAAHVAGVDRLFAMGGAQAVAALAFGTQTVPKVDKIMGPGNRYVVLAKREVYGVVGMEGLPGPTETLIIADDSASPVLLAADMLAQAEHGPDSEAWLLSPSKELLEKVFAQLEAQVSTLPREAIARKALERSGLVLVNNLDQALELSNLYAPEHLCLGVENPEQYLEKVHHAGGIFLGEYSCEAPGDYIAGPSHVMPTNGTARFSAGLAVRDFIKVIPVVGLNQSTSGQLARLGARMAREEGLEAHARALDLRSRSDF